MKNIILWRIFCLLTMINLCSCKKNENEVNKETNKNKRNENYLEFYYLGPGNRYTRSISCGEISDKVFKNSMNYKVNYDMQHFEKFIALYKKYKPIEDSSGIDARIKVIVHNKNEIDTLCLGECFSTYRNGEKVNDNRELLLLVKKIIDFNNTLSFYERKYPERFHREKVSDTFDPCPR